MRLFQRALQIFFFYRASYINTMHIFQKPALCRNWYFLIESLITFLRCLFVEDPNFSLPVQEQRFSFLFFQDNRKESWDFWGFMERIGRTERIVRLKGQIALKSFWRTGQSCGAGLQPLHQKCSRLRSSIVLRGCVKGLSHLERDMEGLTLLLKKQVLEENFLGISQKNTLSSLSQKAGSSYSSLLQHFFLLLWPNILSLPFLLKKFAERFIFFFFF